MDFKVFADGEPLDMDRCRIDGYERFLDFRDGTLHRRFAWRTRGGAVLEASYQRFVSRKRERVCVQEIAWRCLAAEAVLHIESAIDARVRTNGHDHFTSVRGSVDGGRALVEVTTDTGDRVALCSEVRASRVAFTPAVGNDRRPACAAEARLRPGSELRIVKISAVATSRDPGIGADLAAAAAAEVASAFTEEDRLYPEHAAAWAAMWKASAVTIGGDPRAQHALNFALYHLLRAANPRDSRAAICAKGSAGEAYFGHFFWDTEIYLLPFFLYSRPDAARRLVEFRIETLDGARRNAKAYGYRGARYPWESSVTGDEQCPNWHYADFEVHVTADVVHAVRHAAAAADDEDLAFRAAEMLVETSRYWASRVERRADGSVNLNGVMGPDEYTCFSNNNAYTNGMVKRALRFTLRTLASLERRRPAEHAALAQRLGVTAAELADFEAIAAGLPVRIRSDGVIVQCDGFERLEDIDVASVWKDRSRPFGHFVSQERNYRSKALKQADALMLAYLFPTEFTPDLVAATYDYYEPLTTHDSSLSCVVHSILACRLGRRDEAYTLFGRSLGIDLDAGGGGAAEGIHIANCAGIWQAVIVGFAGMSWAYESPAPRFEPRLPVHWTSLEFPLRYAGRAYEVRITPGGVDMREVNS
jgi:trehalose/maltose hydrolase-like predicted phosphorylase